MATTNGAFCITCVFPILGGRKVEHLLANLEALDISISDEQIKCLESIISFDVGCSAVILNAPIGIRKTIDITLLES